MYFKNSGGIYLIKIQSPIITSPYTDLDTETLPSDVGFINLFYIYMMDINQ